MPFSHSMCLWSRLIQTLLSLIEHANMLSFLSMTVFRQQLHNMDVSRLIGGGLVGGGGGGGALHFSFSQVWCTQQIVCSDVRCTKKLHSILGHTIINQYLYYLFFQLVYNQLDSFLDYTI